MTENCTIGYLYAAGIQNDEQRFRLTVYKEQWKRSDNGDHDMVYFSVNSIKWPERCLTKGEYYPEDSVWNFHLAHCRGNENQTFFVKNKIPPSEFPDC
ncbi:hypothetical protein TYRP_018133 [Tyrophagus putrescentiae]|nr:hypothetical protein TYRP_018133 [Tyrophagus putrescentiae]